VTALRDLTSSTIFHVLNRGADRQDIFWRDADRQRFLDELGARAERHGVSVFAFALMSNHYHAVVETDGADLPEMMRDLQSGYAGHLNWRTDRSGPLFERRYTSIPVMDDAQFVQLIRYVHRNPIDITGSAELARWPWSSLRAIVGMGGGPEWLRRDLLERRMDLTGHLAYVLAPQLADRLPYAWLPPLRVTGFDDLRSCVDDVCGGLETMVARRALVLLAIRFRSASPTDLAAFFGVSAKTVRNARAASKAMLVDDPKFARLIEEVVGRLP
jgi:REP element-mobilizing transposase RayT